MMISFVSPTLLQARAEFEDLVKDIRPELHRYAARMVGSVMDGEDLEWKGERVSQIRDYRYARYVTEDAEITIV